MRMSRARHALAVAALVAMTLLACMPTLSRVLRASQALERGAPTSAVHDIHDGDIAMPGMPRADDDCDYCALLPVPATSAVPQVVALRDAPTAARTPQAAHTVGRASWTLGPRGPPAARAG